MRFDRRPRIGFLEHVNAGLIAGTLKELRRNFRRKTDEQLHTWLKVLNRETDHQYTIDEVRGL